MLDKSVPYASLYMHRRAGAPIPAYPLPPGFRFALFQDGDEAAWARIETSVGEFDSEFAALMLFKEKFLPYRGELYRRLLFIEAPDGTKVATANAWWADIECRARVWLRLNTGGETERRAWIHWVGVNPGFQGLGLGKSAVSHAMEIMRGLDGDVDMFLRTQTWSYKAIGIYKKCGFEPTSERALYSKDKRNDYKKALKILSDIENGKIKTRAVNK